MKTEPYSAISCQSHSELELIIMHKNLIQIELEQGKFLINPYDIKTEKDKGEFLLAMDETGANMKIRLDHIKHWSIIK